jgi:cysteinyl-tRNA synthetase
MHLYNSLTHSVDEFKPLKDDLISIYSCGPTVYNNAHIGNLSSYLYADILKRALAYEFPAAKIAHVMNITDIDDKTIKESQERYPDLDPHERLKKVTREYEKLFLADLNSLGIDTNNITFVRATDYIAQMQAIIKDLVENKIAYITDDGVYFSIAAYKNAGKTYGQLVTITAESTGSARVNNDEYDKDNIHDFSLWKVQKPDEPAWDFEIGGKQLKGRPGWHIECSAMSVDKLGAPFDIHTGGVDLKFPHHENEIAQSTAVGENNILANFFFHSEHMLVEGQRMAKSAENFFTLRDIIDKNIDPLTFRLFVLQSHYRSQSHFSWVNLQAAQNRLDRMRRVISLQPVTAVAEKLSINRQKNKPDEQFIEIGNDLNIAGVLETIETELTAYEKNSNKSMLSSFLQTTDELLGLNLSTSLQSNLTSEQLKLIDKREATRQAADWAESDKLRTELKAQGIGLRDTVEGTIWFQL